MVSVFQALPLDVDDVLNGLEKSLHNVAFTNEVGEHIYPVDVVVKEFPTVSITMSDGSKFKLTVEEVS